MERIKLVLTVLLLLTNVFCQEMSVEDEENKWPNSQVIQDILVRITRNQGQRQYLGLLGKKHATKSRTARKQHKFRTFVGLMGKRSFGDQGAL